MMKASIILVLLPLCHARATFYLSGRPCSCNHNPTDPTVPYAMQLWIRKQQICKHLRKKIVQKKINVLNALVLAVWRRPRTIPGRVESVDMLVLSVKTKYN